MAAALALVAVAAGDLPGQAPSPPAATPDKAPPAGVVRYHEMLLRRPQAGVVFDRFYDTWLGVGTVEEMNVFLEKRASAPAAKPADHLVLALYFTRRGEDGAALKAYARALELDPSNATAWGDRARLEARMQDIEAALKSLEHGIAAKPDANLLLELSKQRARHLLRLGKNEEALKAFREMVAAQPDDVDLAEEVVYIQVEEGLFEEAAKGTEALISKTKDAYQKVVRLLLLGDIRQKAGQRDEAVKAYEEALRLAGKDTWVEGEVLARIEQTFRREDELEGLSRKLGDLAATDPARVRLGQRHAQALADIGRVEDAIKVYQDLLARTPGQASVREGFLNLLESADKLAEAIEQAKALRAQMSGDKEWIIRLAVLQHRAKDDTAAQASLNEYLAVNGTGESDRLRVARLLETWDLKEQAKVAYESLVKAHTDSVSAREAQAQFLHRIEEREAALAIWRDIAAKGSLEDALQVGQALGARMEYPVALEVLSARVASSPGEPRLLAALCTAAAGAKEFTKAIPWARERVRLARDVSEVEESIKAASMIIRNANMAETLAKEIAALPSPLAAERCLLAELRESMKDHAGADAALAALTGPDEALGLQQQVRLLQGRQEWNRAATTMAKLIALPDGRSSSNVQKLVDLHQRAGQTNEAITWISEWKKLSPGAVTPWMTEARLLSESGRADDAIKVLREAYRKFSDNPDLAATYGDQLIAAGQTHEAMQVFETWYEKTEDITGKMRWAGGLARAAAGGGNTAQLVERFRERQKKNRQSVVPWLALAEIHRATGNAEGRRTAIMEAATLRPQDLDLLLELARLQEEDGLWKDSLATLETARTLDKGTKVKERQAAIHLRYGDENLGYRILFELAGGDQMDARGIERMADGIAARGEWERVTEFLEPLMTKHPRDYRLRFLHAVALEESGREKEAIQAFIALMQPMEELPGVVVPEGGVTGMPRNPYQEQMLKSTPPGVASFQELNQAWYMAYRYQQNRGASFGSYSYPFAGSGVQAGFVSVPPYALSAPSYAAVHLISLAQSLGKMDREDLAARLKRADVAQADMFLHLQWDPQRGGVVVDEAWLEEHPEDEAALAWWIINSMSRGQMLAAGSSEGLLRKCYDRFHKRYPGLALQASFTARDNGTDEGRALFAEGIKLAASLEKMDYFCVQALVSQLQRRRSGHLNPLPEEDEEQLIAVLKKQARNNGDRTEMIVPWMMTALGALLAEKNKWDDAIELAQADQDQFEKAQADPSSRSKPGTPFIYMSASRMLVTPMPFPVDSLGVSQGALAIISPSLEGRLSSTPAEPMPGEETPRNEELLKAASKLKHDILRHLAMLGGGDRDSFFRFLEAKLNAEPDRVAPLLLAAWYAQQTQNHPKAVQHLQKALTLSLSAQERTMVECALLHNAAASQTSKDGKPDPAMTAELLEGARELARRQSRNTSLNYTQKEYLARTVELLGMTKEAAQLRTAPKVAPTRSRQSSYSTARLPSSQSMPATVDQLALKKQPDAAAREAVRQLRMVIPELLTSNAEYAAARVEDLLTVVKKHDLADAILKSADPGDTGSIRRKMEYAGLHELLGRQKEALPLYESILVTAPRATEAQARVINLLSATDPETAAQRLAQMKPGTPLTTVIQNLVQVMQNGSGRTGLSRRIAATRTLTAFLETRASGGMPLDNSLNYLLMAPRGIGQTHYGRDSGGESAGDPRLPDLYSLTLYNGTHQSSEELEGEKSARGKERREAHDALCRAMMKVPELSNEGFAALAGLSIAEKQDPAPLRTLAIECLKLAADPASQRRIQLARTNSFSYSSGGPERLWQPKPVEFLIYTAWKEQAEERLEKEIYPLLKSGESGKDTPALLTARAYAKLWFGKPEEFSQTADAWVKMDNARINAGQAYWHWFSDGGYMENLLRLAVERKLDTDLDDWIVGKIKEAVRSNNHVDLDFLQPWLGMKAVKGGTEGVIKFVEKLGDGLFGSAEGRRKAGQEYITQRYGGVSSPTPRSYFYGQFIEGLLRSSKVPAAALTIMVRENWLDSPAAAQQIVYELDEDSLYLEAAPLATLLASPPFAAEAGGFRAYSSKRRDTPTVLGELLHNLRRREKTRAAVLEQLKKNPAPSFGHALCIASLEPKHDIALMAFITARKEELAKLSPIAQDELREALKQVWSALERPENLPEDRQEILRPLFASELKTAAERRAMVLAASSLEELKMEDGFFFQFLRTQFVKLAAEGKDDEAVRLFEKGCDLIEKKMASKGWDDGENWNGWTPRSQLADAIMDWRFGWDLVRLGVRLYNTDTSGKLQHPGHPVSNQWNKTVLDSWKREGGYWRPDTALHVTLSRIHGNLKGQNSAILMPMLADLVSHVPPRLRASLVAWAEGEGAKKPYASLARHLAVAARFQHFTSPGKKVVLDANGKRPEDPAMPSMRAEDWDFLVGIMEDTSLNPRVRLSLGNWICHHGREEVDSRVVYAAMKLSVDGLRNSWAASAYHLAAVLRCFNQEPVNEAWKELAKEVWDAWAMRNARNQESSRMGRAYNPTDTAVFAMWETAVRARETGWQAKLRKDFPNTLADNYLTFVAMVRQDDLEGATTFLRTQWGDLTQWVPYFDSLDTVNSESNIAEGVAMMRNAAAGEKFAAACADPALAEYGRILMNVGNDPPQGYRERFGGPPDYRARRNLAAQTFRPEVFTGELMRTRATGWLFGASAANDKISPVVAALAAKMDLKSLGPVNNSQTMRWRILMPLMDSHNRALKGDFQAFEDFYDISSQHPKWDHWLRENIKEYSARMALSRTRLFWRSQPPAKATDMLPLTETILKRYSSDDDHQIGDALGVRTAMYLYDGDFEGLANWRKALPPEQATQFLERFRTQSSLFVTLGDLCGRDPKVRLPLERRLALIEAAVKDDWTQKNAKTNPGASFKMPILTGRTNLLSRPELIAHGMKIAALIPREGRSFYEMADRFEEEGLAEQTLAALDAVIAVVGNNQSLRNPALIRKAETLDNMGKNAEAMKVLEGMDIAKLPVGLRLQVERLQRKEQEAARKAAAPKP